MNKTTLNLIQRALNVRSECVPNNDTWRKLHQNHGIGTPTANGYRITHHDLQTLHHLYQQNCSQDPQLPLPDNPDRLDAASIYADEKTTHKDVFADHLVFAIPNGTSLPTTHGDLCAAIPGVVPTISLAQLDSVRITRLIVIENATMLTRWHDWHHLLPSTWQEALLLYRGHGNNQLQVKQLIHTLSDHCNLAYYPDFDPCGLDICASFAKQRTLSVIVPAAWHSLTQHHHSNQPLRFAQQAGKLDHIRTRIAAFPTLSTLLHHIEQQQLAIMQEQILRTGDLIALQLTNK